MLFNITTLMSFYFVYLSCIIVIPIYQFAYHFEIVFALFIPADNPSGIEIGARIF
jgi:hypothetical protein